MRDGIHPAIYQGVGVGTMTDIYAARIGADGSVIDNTPITIRFAGYNQTQPKVVWNGSNWLIAWQTERENNRYESDINAVRVAPSGTLLDAAPFPIGTHLPNPNGSSDLDPIGPISIASNGSDWFVTYRCYNPNLAGGIGMEWFATKVATDGTVANLQGTQLLAADQYTQDFGLAFSQAAGGGAGEFLHAWRNAYADNGAIFVNRFDRNLNPIAGSTRSFVPSGLTKAAMAGSSGGWIVTWEDNIGSWAKIQAARISATGALTDATPFDVTPFLGQVDMSLDAEWDGSNWLIAYSKYSSNTKLDQDIFLRRVKPTGTAKASLLSEAPVITGPGNQTVPQISRSNGGAVRVLFEDDVTSSKPGISVTTISSSNALLGRADVALAAPSQGAPELASDGTSFLSVFSSSTAFVTRLLAQRVAPDGSALDAAPIVLADSSLLAGTYQVSFIGGRYVATFTANGPQGQQIYARQISVNGALIGGLVPMTSGLDMGDASVLKLAGGERLILVGNSNEGNPEFSYRFARIFDANLNPLGGRFMIGTSFALEGHTTAVTGRWLASWATKPTHDSPYPTISYVFIHPDGTTTGEASLTAFYPGNGTPTVVSSPTGEALVTWPRTNGVISPEFVNEDAIVGQRFAGNGSLLGGRITLFDQPGGQAQLHAVFDPTGGNYVLSWTDQRNHPYPAQAQDDIFAARLATDGTVLDTVGVPVADNVRPEWSSAVGAAGGRVLVMYRSFRTEVPFGSYREAARSISFAAATPPSVPDQPWFDDQADRERWFNFT
jgi:hypothetical protein